MPPHPFAPLETSSIHPVPNASPDGLLPLWLRHPFPITSLWLDPLWVALTPKPGRWTFSTRSRYSLGTHKAADGGHSWWHSCHHLLIQHQPNTDPIVINGPPPQLQICHLAIWAFLNLFIFLAHPTSWDRKHKVLLSKVGGGGWLLFALNSFKHQGSPLLLLVEVGCLSSPSASTLGLYRFNSSQASFSSSGRSFTL